MNHIWFDDEREPGILPYYQQPPYVGVEWVWIKTVPAFKRFIEKHGMESVGFLALDHDLGVCVDCQRRMDQIVEEAGGWPKGFGEGGPVWALREEVLIRQDDKVSYSSCKHNGDGTELVRWMADNNLWPTMRPTVHSFNPDGARRMRDVIDEHYAR